MEKAIALQTEYPNAQYGSSYSGQPLQFSTLHASIALAAYYDAFSAEKKDPDRKRAIFQSAMEFQLKHPDACYNPSSMMYPLRFDSHASYVLEAFRNALLDQSDPAKKAEYIVWATDIQSTYPNACCNPTGRYEIKFNGSEYTVQIHTELQAAIQKTMSSEDVVRLYNVWTTFNQKFPSADAAYSPTYEKWQGKYAQAMADLSSKGALVPTSNTLQTTSNAAAALTTTSARNVASILSKYGSMFFGDTSSLKVFKEDFLSLYRTAALRLHPDQNPSDGVRMQELNADKTWVEGLTEETFQTARR